jgi:hypothetical protein
MIGFLAAVYLCGASGALTPASSGRPCLIHAIVELTGLDPTCRYTPSSLGEKLRNGSCVSASEPGGKSTTIIAPRVPLTGYGPTPSPAFVRAVASALAASPSAAKVRCASFFGSQAMCEDGDMTLSPSIRFNDTPDRGSLINSGSHPNLETTIAISLARFCASESPGMTWISNFFPAQRSKPENHCAAFGCSLMPIRPIWRGNNTVCSARFSDCRRAVWLLSDAIRSFECFRFLGPVLLFNVCGLDNNKGGKNPAQ